VSGVAFYLLSLAMPARFAFTLVYAAGIAFVALVTPRWVFGVSSSVARRLLLGLWYVFTYLVGLGMIALLEGPLDAPTIVVVVGTLCVTAPLSFLGGRLLVGRSGYGSGSTPSG